MVAYCYKELLESESNEKNDIYFCDKQKGAKKHIFKF